MMHLEYRKSSYKGTHIDIRPNHECDIPKLREMVMNNLNIKNPLKAFESCCRGQGRQYPFRTLGRRIQHERSNAPCPRDADDS